MDAIDRGASYPYALTVSFSIRDCRTVELNFHKDDNSWLWVMTRDSRERTAGGSAVQSPR